MATVTIYTKDISGVQTPWELEIGTNYVFTIEGYGIIVIEDTMRTARGKEVGAYRDEKLTLVATPRLNFDLEVGDEGKRIDLNAAIVVVETGLVKNTGAVRLYAPAVE